MESFHNLNKILGLSANKDVKNIELTEYRGLTFREFWEKLPHKLEYYDYEEELEQTLKETKHLWVKKSAGLGITEFMIRWIAWNCLKDDEWKNKQIDIGVVLITGPRIDLAITIINRMKNLFDIPFRTKETLLILNGVRIQAFPSHHVATAHGLNPIVVWPDEGDFFPPGQQDKAREVAERYIAKTNPYIIWTSTPYLPGGLYEQIEREEDSLYTKKIMLYKRGLGKVYSEADIEIAKQSPSFEREYNGQYGFGEGNIFPFVDICVEEYDLELKGGNKGLYCDPAFGGSQFGSVGFEKLDGILYVKEAKQYDRPSPTDMIEKMVLVAKDYDNHVKVDAAHPGFIKDLRNRGVGASAMTFGMKIDSENPETNKFSQANIMTTKASKMVKTRKVLIHPIFKDLIAQLRSVKYDDKGKPDKTELTFDLGDPFLMGCTDMADRNIKTISVSDDGQLTNYTKKEEEQKKTSSLKFKTETFE